MSFVIFILTLQDMETIKIKQQSLESFRHNKHVVGITQKEIKDISKEL